MPAEGTSLASLQHWLLDAITDVRPLPIVLAGLAPEVDAILAPTPGLSPAGSLEIYRRMGLARFEAALRDDHELLAALLGDERFAALTAAYVTRHPSGRWTLDGLDARLPDFLAGFAEVPEAERAALADLARLETTIAAVRLAPHRMPLANGALSSLPPERLDAVALVLAPSLVLLDLDHDAVLALSRHARGSRVQRPPKRRTRTVVLRTKQGVRWWREPAATSRLLRRLVDGATLGVALAAADLPSRTLIRAAFTRWAEAGVFVDVVTMPPESGLSASPAT